MPGAPWVPSPFAPEFPPTLFEIIGPVEVAPFVHEGILDHEGVGPRVILAQAELAVAPADGIGIVVGDAVAAANVVAHPAFEDNNWDARSEPGHP